MAKGSEPYSLIIKRLRECFFSLTGLLQIYFFKHKENILNNCLFWLKVSGRSDTHRRNRRQGMQQIKLHRVSNAANSFWPFPSLDPRPVHVQLKKETR